MPISKEQFNQGLNDTEVRIIQFLDQNPSQAFTAFEIQKALGYAPPKQPVGEGVNLLVLSGVVLTILWLGETLKDLTSKRKIVVNIIDGERYYATKS